ncbi:unnamed protein product [Sphagnum balticum]
MKTEGRKLEQELTIQQKIEDLLRCPTPKGSQELADIVNGYRGDPSSAIWNGLEEVHAKFLRAAVEF